MSKTKVFVWHDLNGQIVAIGRATGKRKVSAIAGQGQGVVETEVEHEKIKTLHRSHVVDLFSRTVTEKKAQG